MATLWDLVTGNSTLAVEAGNTFYDHLNNQKAGSIAGGRADMSIQSESNTISFIATNERITTQQDQKGITMTEDKKGITL